MSNSVGLFLFKSCKTRLCDRAYSAVMSNLSALGVAFCELFPQLKGKDVNIIFADGRTLRDLNKRFRRVDVDTDVLAFPMMGKTLGEVWICPGVIKRNAVEYEEEFEIEVLRIVIHGILHLAGLDHKNSFRGGGTIEEKMYRLQERVLGQMTNDK